MRSLPLGLILSVISLSLFGCGDTQGANGEDAEAVVGVVLDSGGLGDQSFNDSAWAGAQRAEDELGVSVVNVSSNSESDYVSNLSGFADRGFDLVVAVGINQKTALDRVATDYPDTNFALIDNTVEHDNVRSILFSEEEGSFLVGYLAGLMTETDAIGFVGGQEIALIKKFEYGYYAGAKMANPNVEILPAKYVGSWDDVGQAKEAANQLFRSGADIVYHAAGRAGLGVISAAKENDKYAIGVDSDQDHVEEGYVLTSMVKRVDEAVFQTIQDVVNNEFSGGTVIYDLEADGVGLSELRFTREAIGEERLEQVQQVRERIASGEIEPPKTEEEYEAFLARQ
ncbi:MAG: BMP family lipoprotein [Fimbriimonadaceae bacterium]